VLNRVGILIFILFVSGHVFATPPADCPDAFRDLFENLKPHVGNVSKHDRFPDAQVSFLGQGVGGGDVYLIRPNDGSSHFVVKDYVLGGSDSAFNDVIGLRILEQVTDGRATPKALRPVKILDQLDDDSLKLEYISGRDLQKVARETTDDEARLKLARLFDRQTETIKNNMPVGKEFTVGGGTYTVLDSNYHTSMTKGFRDLVVMMRRKTNPFDKVVLWIKPENVVLTQEGELVIIDPR
jgi:hypothetical protein